MPGSCAFYPARCPGVPRIFLTTPHAATALGLHYGQGGPALVNGRK